MPKPNNPAGRIHAILTEVKNQKPNKTNRQVWATVFNIKPSDTAQLLYALSELIQQLQLTRNRIQALESIEQNLYLGPINTLKKNFITATILDANCDAFIKTLTSEVMQGIAFCVDTLSQHESEELLEKAQLDKLQSQAEELISELVDSDLPENLKAILADHLENLRRSIINYKIWGADGIQRALDLSIATLVRHQNELKKHKDQPVLKKLLGLIAQVDKVVSTVQKVKQLLGPLASYLTGGDIDTLPGP